MTEEREEAPAKTPHFTSEDASDAGPESPSVAPDEVDADSEESSDPEDRAPTEVYATDDAVTKTGLDDAEKE